MDSSTSHSKVWFPRQAAALLGVALLTWAACVFYSLRLNPEVRHYAQAEAIKNAWAQKMTREYGAKVIVIGSSSCEFSIDGQRMLEKYHLPTVNYGRAAGVGGVIMVDAVLAHLRRGDTLILAFEPILVTKAMEATSVGVQFGATQHHPEWALNPAFGVGGVNWFEYLAMLRPGGYHVLTLLGKIARGAPLYRYKLSDVRPSGWKQTDVRVPATGPAGHGDHLSEDGRVFLGRLRVWCQQHGVRAGYSMPWSYTPPGFVSQFQAQNAQILLQIAAFLPILKDPRLGADPHPEDFADTGLHLITPAAEVRSDELAEQIISWNVWSVEELKGLEKIP